MQMQAAIMTANGGGDGIMQVGRILVYGCAGRVQTGTSGYRFFTFTSLLAPGGEEERKNHRGRSVDTGIPESQ